MNEVTVAIGIDVSKDKLDIALLRIVAPSKLKNKVVLNSASGHEALIRWLLEHEVSQPQAHVCMEATGPYSEVLAQTLVDAGWIVSVVNPLRVKGFAQGELSRNKTDRADAAMLARFCLAMHPAPWTPPAVEFRQLRAWVDRLQALKDMRQQEANRVEAHQAAKQETLVASVKSHIEWLDKQIDEIEQQIDDHIDRHPNLKNDAELIKTIPGIGNITVAKVLAYGGDLRRFANAKALAAFVGVSPRQRLSGTSIKGRTLLSRAGHKDLRKSLYMPGLVALRYNPVVNAMAQRLRANGLAPKAIVGAAMRKLVHLIYGVITSGRSFDINIAMPRLDLQDGI